MERVAVVEFDSFIDFAALYYKKKQKNKLKLNHTEKHVKSLKEYGKEMLQLGLVCDFRKDSF